MCIGLRLAGGNQHRAALRAAAAERIEQIGIVLAVKLFKCGFQTVVLVADIAFGQNIVAVVVLRVVAGAAVVGGIHIAAIFAFVALAAGEHQQAFGVFAAGGGGGGYPVAAVAAAVAVFQAEVVGLIGINKIARRIGFHVDYAAQCVAAVERGIRPFHNIGLLERIGFEQIAAGNRAVATAAGIRFRQAYAVYHHQNAVAGDAADVHTCITATAVVGRHAHARFV